MPLALHKCTVRDFSILIHDLVGLWVKIYIITHSTQDAVLRMLCFYFLVTEF